MAGTTRPSSTGPSNGSRESAPRWFAAHELRTPLQAIKGGVELLLEAQGAGLRPDLLDAVSLIATAATDLERQLDLLAELGALADAPRPAPQAVALLDLLARPEVAQALALPETIGGLPSTLQVLVAPEPFGRALTLLVGAQSGRPGPMPCALRLAGSAGIRLELGFVACGSGAGSVALRLARELLDLSAVHWSEDDAPGPQPALLLALRRS